MQRNEQEIQKGFCGDNLKVKLKGIEEDEISSGFILCDPDNACHVGRVFDAQVDGVANRVVGGANGVVGGANALYHVRELNV